MLLPDWDAPGGLNWRHLVHPPFPVFVLCTGWTDISQCPACLLWLDFLSTNPDGHISVALPHYFGSVFDLEALEEDFLTDE